MNRESDEQRAVSQTLCGALQKEANCKCLVLSVLIYGCLAAVTWCRCANVTKVVINFDNYPLKRTEHVSPCDEGYIYIPVAFMGMLYLVYLVECYHSPIRIDLMHAESQDNVTTKLSQLKLALPTIWWKAVSYHYVRRKRQITRYRNGDNYTTTQVYYERANTHAATSFYFYDYCGVKDISKDLTMEPKIPITKITLTKGFAFSNMRSATEFEEARSRFFAEQEMRDDYMEMREGLDLGYNFNPTTVVGILGNPWFTNSYVYWCLSALLLSWPLRIIIEYNTQYADYQVTKLFGVNYDTPTSGEPIHASSSQLSAPGSYMLAPSYSEALLMDPSPQPIDRRPSARSSEDAGSLSDRSCGDIVPSYSEALLYERAQQISSDVAGLATSDFGRRGCDCFCHAPTQEYAEIEVAAAGPLDGPAKTPTSGPKAQEQECESSSSSSSSSAAACQRCRANYSNGSRPPVDFRDRRRTDVSHKHESDNFRRNSLEACGIVRDRRGGNLTRDLSAPNFQTQSEFASNTQFLRHNGNSLENILENDELTELGTADPMRTAGPRSDAAIAKRITGCGAIPKHKPRSSTSGEFASTSTTAGSSCRLIENPLVGEDRTVPRSENDDGERNMSGSKTYFCLKSILKQHKRRYTLVTAEELRKLASDEIVDECPLADKNARTSRDNRRTHPLFNRDHFFWRNKDAPSTSGQSTGVLTDQRVRRVDSSRSLIFASPIEEVCRSVPNDPFGGKALHVLPPRTVRPPDYDEAMALPRFSKLARSLTSVPHKCLPAEPLQRVRSNRVRSGGRHHRRNLSIEPEYLLRADGWSTPIDGGKPSIAEGRENESHHTGSSIGSEEAAGSGCAEPTPAQNRRTLTRGLSLNDGRTPTTERTKRKILRTSLTDTSGSTSSFCFVNDQAEESDKLVAKHFDVSMETSL